MKGPSIINDFFEIPIDDPSKFSILSKHLLDLIEGTSQLYFPSFSVIAIRFQFMPSSGEIYIFILS